MSTLVKINPVVYNNVHSLRRLYNEIESHVHSLLTLDIDIQDYGSMAVCKSTVSATFTTQLYNKANSRIFKFLKIFKFLRIFKFCQRKNYD